MHEVFRDVETDAASADHRDVLSDRLAVEDHVEVVQHLRMLDPWNRRGAWRDAGGQDHVVVTRATKSFTETRVFRHSSTRRGLQLAAEVAQGFEELLLARHALGDVELAADFAGRIEQGHLMPALGGDRCRRQTRRPGTDHGDFLDLLHRQVIELGFVAGTRVDQATGEFAAEGVIEARLVAADAGVDFIGAPGGGLVDEVGVGEKRPRHRDHVGIAFAEDLLGDFRGVDAVGGDQRDLHRADAAWP